MSAAKVIVSNYTHKENFKRSGKIIVIKQKNDTIFVKTFINNRGNLKVIFKFTLKKLAQIFSVDSRIGQFFTESNEY